MGTGNPRGPTPIVQEGPHLTNMIGHCQNYPNLMETATTAVAGDIVDDCLHGNEESARDWRLLDEDAFAQGNSYGSEYNVSCHNLLSPGSMAGPDSSYHNFANNSRRKERPEDYWDTVKGH